VIAHENLRKPKIALALDRAMAERCGVTRPRIVDELAKIAFSDLRKVVSWRPEMTTVASEGEEGEAKQFLVSRVTVPRQRDLER
jgi:phage terminase small subunit